MNLSEQQDIFFAHPHLTGALRPAPPRYAFEERIAAVAAVGSSGMGLATSELDEIRKTRSPNSLRGVLADHGVRIGELELLLGWHADGEEADKGLAADSVRAS